MKRSLIVDLREKFLSVSYFKDKNKGPSKRFSDPHNGLVFFVSPWDFCKLEVYIFEETISS